MSEPSKKALVPVLRFPEFREAGEWVFIPLNIQAKRCTQKNREGEITRVLTNSAEYGVVDQRDYFDKDIATQGNLEGYFIVEKGDYVYNPRISATAPVGPISRNNIATGVMSPLYTVFRFKNIDNDFYAHYFKSTGWHHYMRQISSTGARHDRMAITNDSFMAMPVPVASSEELQKIADCLSSIDELVTAQTQKLEALKAHKKGLMQQLFPAEGETVPKLRFPEFRDAGEWEVRPLKDLAYVVMGSSPSSGAYNTEAVGLPFMQGNADIKNGLSAPRLFTSQITKECEVGDVLLSVRAPVGTVAKSIHHACIGRGLAAIRALPLNPQEYLYQWLLSFESQWHKLSQGGTFDAVNSDDVRDLRVDTPRDPKEQQKIADCLSSIDELITAQTQKLAVLKAHKKGLMQQLFPTADEIVG